LLINWKLEFAKVAFLLKVDSKIAIQNQISGLEKRRVYMFVIMKYNYSP
jgi:hypothetical protein